MKYYKIFNKRTQIIFCLSQIFVIIKENTILNVSCLKNQSGETPSTWWFRWAYQILYKYVNHLDQVRQAFRLKVLKVLTIRGRWWYALVTKSAVCNTKLLSESYPISHGSSPSRRKTISLQNTIDIAAIYKNFHAYKIWILFYWTYEEDKWILLLPYIYE